MPRVCRYRPVGTKELGLSFRVLLRDDAQEVRFERVAVG